MCFYYMREMEIVKNSFFYKLKNFINEYESVKKEVILWI